MKKLATLTGLLLLTALTACNKQTTNETFGGFSYNGIFLKEYATKQIGVNEAKRLVDVSSYETKPRKLITDRSDEISDDVQTVLKRYGSMTTIVKYYVSDSEQQQVRRDIYQGTDFKNLLETNYYEPFGQMSVRYLFVNDDLLDDMERQNAEFEESSSYLVNPFNEPFTYHTNEENQLIVQTHHFAELPASVGGGIGSTFRQDCESIFDKEGKITFWQSSLGLYTSTPTGTVKEGYIFEVEFEWVNK